MRPDKTGAIEVEMHGAMGKAYGKTRKMRYTLLDLALLEERLGQPLMKALNAEEMGIKETMAIVGTGLHIDWAGVTRMPDNMDELAQAAAVCIAYCMGADLEPEEEVEPKKKKGKRTKK